MAERTPYIGCQVTALEAPADGFSGRNIYRTIEKNFDDGKGRIMKFS